MPIQNKKLAEKISSMAATDQKWRKLAINDSNNKRLIKKVYECDGKNIAETKKIIEKYGWPTFELVGKRASNSFWLLIQHADRDLKFQKECLALLIKAAKNGQAKLKNIALLTDRIKAAENKKIVYGTQYMFKDNQFVIRPVIDPNIIS